jgi:hypothetical protein
MEDGRTLMEAELSKENSQFLSKKQKVLEDVISIIEACFDNQF